MHRSLDKSRIMKHPPKMIRLGIGDDELPGFDRPFLMAHPRKRGLWKANADIDHGFFNMPMRDHNGANAYRRHAPMHTVFENGY